MDNNSEPEIDNEEVEEPEVDHNMVVDSDEEDEFPEFGNDENKKLFELIRQKKRYIKKVNKEHDKDF